MISWNGYKTPVSFSLTLNPTYVTYTGSASLLDLSICSASISHAVDCYVSESNFESDHYPVIITWSILDHTPKKNKVNRLEPDYE
ncbi:hypothetical protein AVEN_10562-1 [Araneus ventricosus]|uniref:Endonuclease/exonuclease/phosphatase domain-containing protein n=1 Tax=Araneus ventricosus TaxID=182803 RepID=A0A4Y2NEI5_ARAVE|nr:hypothetical protein AVEN_10562-1 [Araneus ventricosus]